MIVDDRYITPQKLAELANTVAERWPDARLYRAGNGIQNLVIHVPVHGEEFVGIIDLLFGEVTIFGDTEGEPVAAGLGKPQ